MPIRKLSFSVPHTRAHSGGVYAISTIAHALRDEVEVSIVNTGREAPAPSADRVVHAPDLDPERLPEADVIVIPADFRAPDALTRLPGSAGSPVLYLQGFGKNMEGDRHRSPINRNLDYVKPVVACSGWLADEVRQRGNPVRHVRYGFDRTVFHPGPPAEQREPLACMLASHKPRDWKGTEDGSRVLARTLRERPEAHAAAFGPADDLETARAWMEEALGVPTGPLRGRKRRRELAARVTMLATPSREEVGELLRHAAVFVCSSREEGFGMPGLEALACGASLATTDTKGSRDYAFAGETALVTPPGEPEQLAASVLELVGDRELRGSLARRGHQFVDSTFPSWPKAAREFRDALEEVIQEA